MGPTSTILLEEYFDSQDPRFVEELRRAQKSQQLAAFAGRWISDPRPWAREQMLAYLDGALSTQGHHPLVKRLFKDAETRGDEEILGAFAAAFDRLVRRKRQLRWHGPSRTFAPGLALAGTSLLPQYLPPSIRGSAKIIARPFSSSSPKEAYLFSARTRHHLRRRIWRHYRKLGFRDPARYREAICHALVRYRDEDLASGESVLDSFTLLRAVFRHHPALALRDPYSDLARDARLADLRPSPAFPEAWSGPAAADALFDRLLRAASSLVRAFASEWLRDHHAEFLSTLPVGRLLPLLEDDREDVVALGARLFESAKDLDKLPVSTWRKLLELRNPNAIESVCRAFERHVLPERLSLAELVEITSCAPVPIARAGLRFLQRTALKSDADTLDEIARLGDARCRAIAPEIAAWALARVGAEASHDADRVARFFDARIVETRNAAWSWLEGAPHAAGDAQLWCRLIETPYDESRQRLVRALEKRARLPGVSDEDLSPLWSAVLLGVERGGRDKRRAVEQVGRALASSPARADELLPVLSVALRSVRAPERRSALASIARLVAGNHSVATRLVDRIPELVVLDPNPA